VSDNYEHCIRYAATAIQSLLVHVSLHVYLDGTWAFWCKSCKWKPPVLVILLHIRAGRVSNSCAVWGHQCAYCNKYVISLT